MTRARSNRSSPGLDTNASSALSASCSPSTSRAYSSCSFDASVFLILPARQPRAESDARRTHSSILSPSRITLRAAESSIGRVRSMLSDSMQTLSVVRVSMPRRCILTLRTDVVRFVKDDNSILGQFFGDLLCDLGVQEIVERIDDDVHEWHLMGTMTLSPRRGYRIPHSPCGGRGSKGIYGCPCRVARHLPTSIYRGE